MSGLLGKTITDGTTQLVGVVPAGLTYSLVTVMVTNPTGAEAEIRLYVTQNATPAQVDLVDSRSVLPANGGRIDFECLNCSPNEKIFIHAPAGLVVRVTSIDEA